MSMEAILTKGAPSSRTRKSVSCGLKTELEKSMPNWSQ